jgi:AraC-like DNA-binding protein
LIEFTTPTALEIMETTSPEKGTIAIAFVHEALVCLHDRGLDANALLREAGISPELLSSPTARVSSRLYGALWHRIAQTLDDEFFGMDSHRMKAGSFTLLCHAIIHSDTLERALRRALRFLGLVLDDISGELVRDGETVHIVLHETQPRAKTQAKRAFAYGTYLLILHGLICWLVGRRVPLTRANFRCEEPPYSPEWQILFTRNLHFAQPQSGLSFAASYLEMPNVQNEKTMKEFLRSAPANFLVKYKNSAGLSAQIRRHLKGGNPAQWPDFEALAAQFHVSSATLRRRLQEEGESYRSITDELRRDLAISLLSDTDANVSDIAEQLGFAETSAFHRAFKKWTGTRPGEYRDQAKFGVAGGES